MDLKTGSTVEFFSIPYNNVYVSGYDQSGNPLVMDSANPPNTWLVSAPNSARRILQGVYTGGSVADSNGIWISTYQGIYLSTKDNLFIYMSSISGQPAGGCS